MNYSNYSKDFNIKNIQCLLDDTIANTAPGEKFINDMNCVIGITINSLQWQQTYANLWRKETAEQKTEQFVWLEVLRADRRTGRQAGRQADRQTDAQ